MDWARDNAGINDNDLDNVFRYEEKPTTVVRMIMGKKRPEIWSLEGDLQMQTTDVSQELPQVDESTSGLVSLRSLAKRTGEPAFGGVKKVQSNDWLDRLNEEMPGRSNTQKDLTFASLNEKGPMGSQNSSGRRSVRTLPFSKDIFRLITRKFYTHTSISRAISRADIPIFSSAEIEMGEPDGPTYPAYVYNCRTTNAWEMDLALTATYFPHCGLTFAIVFGCPLSVEAEIIKRLSFAMAETAHPLLMPGIFAEIERTRHVHEVETTIDELETRIFELDMPDSEAETRNQEKRTAWLDTTYLRNALVSWNTQLVKMSEHADELAAAIYKPSKSDEAITAARTKLEHRRSGDPDSVISAKQCEPLDTLGDEWVELGGDVPLRERLVSQGKNVQEMDSSEDFSLRKFPERREDITLQQDPEAYKYQMRRTGHKIKHRLQAISDEYDDKIRDCTMRVDGMAMATQWAHGETNVEIALSTSRESKHMRSIALVTMVFLPGTFFASVFSMTFFNWSNSDGSIVSGYIWIYVLVTVLFTLLTIGCWWYFVIYRPSRRRKVTSEEETPLV
ncbi:uncharacterized protein PAC_02188 [Phialocephala subalpina]|uniref:Uncharacterized protein n=1 Tax=Phialocephala subalpina TaxID=576137 RepID=A0A1L7WHR4_9HELO|nr:uncharacterized protein PAC_02188 [Phialocephala subalpina]